MLIQLNTVILNFVIIVGIH